MTIKGEALQYGNNKAVTGRRAMKRPPASREGALNHGAADQGAAALGVQPSAPVVDRPPEVRFYAQGAPHTTVPSWANWLLQLGRSWECTGNRQIAVVSMPCDSPAAGLVTLGALAGDLGRAEASDVQGHFDSLLRYAKQYLTVCRDCTVRCRPKDRRCGYQHESTGKLRRQLGHQLVGPVVSVTEGPVPSISLHVRGGTVSLHPAAALGYSVHHAPPIETAAEQGLDTSPYRAIVKGCSPTSQNQQRSYSGLCLAGRGTGAEPTCVWLSQWMFDVADRTYPLAELLTIRSWGERGVSRATLFNPRTGDFDRPTSFTRLVVADGDAAFEDALGRREFEQADIIGVLHRTAADDAAARLGERLRALRQWYGEVEVGALQPAPRGMAIQVLQRRT